MIQAPERELEITHWRIVMPLPEIGRTPEARTYIAAAMLLERDGWCQHTSRDDAGRLCLRGALWFTQSFGDFIPLNVIWSRTPRVVAWNDTPGRTKEEVIDLLLRCAKEADGVLVTG